MSETETQPTSPVQENYLIHEQSTLIPLSKEDVLVSGVADKHPRDMPEMAFVIAFCIQYKEAVGNLNFLPEELEDAIVCRRPVDLVERIHRYFLRNALNVTKIIDKRYWVKKLNQLLHERIKNKEFIFSYNPLERINNVYHKLSNFEKVMILKELVMWQIKRSEKVLSMWSEKIQALRQETNIQEIDRPAVEIEVLGVDSKGSTYFYLGVGARLYREIPSTDGSQQCIWEVLTTTLQDLRGLVSDQVEINPDRSEEECLLYNRISKDLISDIESQYENKRVIQYNRSSRKKAKKRKSLRKVLSDEETERTDYENTQNTHANVEDAGSDVEPILSVSMWSVTHPSTNLQPVNPQWNKDDVTSSNIYGKNQLINQNSLTGRHNTETDALKNIDFNKSQTEEEETSDDNSSVQDDYLESNKRIKPGQILYNDELSSYDDDITARQFSQMKRKRSLHNELYDNSEFQNINKPINNTVKLKDKGKSIIRHEGPSQTIEGSYMNHGYKTSNTTTNLSKVVNHEIFRPGPEELIRLEWSLNHIFFEELEIFGEDSDSELSECCDDCIMEVDHLLAH